MDREALRQLCLTDPDRVVDIIEALLERIAALEDRIKTLEAQLKQNSHNSSKPPSYDGFNKPKPKSSRKPSGKPNGGQKGHKGHRLEFVDHPDEVLIHSPEVCQNCSQDLRTTLPRDYERRQVWDLPEIKMIVTEHRAEIKDCPFCGYRNKALFPEFVSSPVKYGDGFKAVVLYLTQYQLLPLERTTQLCADLFGQPVSEATLLAIREECSTRLEPVEQIMKDQLIKSPVIHCDETGFYMKGKRAWLHVASNDRLTHYFAHPKRGKDATQEAGILPNYHGTALHDFWKPYFHYPCSHALCNAHHLRELNDMEENHHQAWAPKMRELLLDIKEAVDQKREVAPELDKHTIQRFEKKYDQILHEGFKKNPAPKERPPNKERGRIKKSKALNFLDRLMKYKKEALAFMYDFNVSFDNNQAERDIRMMKLQQKISGTFRSDKGAEQFCRIRGYISTARKNQLNILSVLQSVFEGHPLIPCAIGE